MPEEKHRVFHSIGRAIQSEKLLSLNIANLILIAAGSAIFRNIFQSTYDTFDEELPLLTSYITQSSTWVYLIPFAIVIVDLILVARFIRNGTLRLKINMVVAGAYLLYIPLYIYALYAPILNMLDAIGSS